MPLRILLITILSLALGCAGPSVGQVDAFSNASTQVLTNTRDALKYVDQSVINRNLYDIASSPNQGPSDLTFEGVFSGNPKGRARQDARLALLDALTIYAQSLHELATADTKSQVDSAATNFYGAMTSLNGTYAKLVGKAPGTTPMLGTVATAVEALGNSIADKARADAVRQAIVAADPAVGQAAHLLEAELGKGSPLAILTSVSLHNAVGSIRQAYNRERAAPDQTFEHRLELLREIQRLTRLADESDALFEELGKSAAALAATHHRLKIAADKEILSSNELVSDIGELAHRAEATHNFYSTLTQPK